MHLIRMSGAAGLWLSLTAAPAVTQQRNDACADAVRLVTSGEATSEHEGWALAQVAMCPDGPAAIVARWRAVGDRPEELAQLRAWNYQIHDQRIADVAMEFAGDPSRPASLRLLALETLVAYFDPRATGLVDLNPSLGSQPPGADVPERVYVLSRRLATDPNPAIARAAKHEWQTLTDVRPSAVALPTGTLSLANMCGRKFRIANHSDIDLSVELVWATGRPSREHRIPAQGMLDMTVAGNEIVRLLFGGREIASAATGQVACR